MLHHNSNNHIQCRVIGIKVDKPALYVVYNDKSTGKHRRRKIPIKRKDALLSTSQLTKEIYQRHYDYLGTIKLSLLEKMINHIKNRDFHILPPTSTLYQQVAPSAISNSGNQRNNTSNTPPSRQIIAPLHQQGKPATVEIDGNLDLNKLSDEEVAKYKRKMDEEFHKNRLLPGQEGYVYDVKKEFGQPVADSEWDDSDSEKSDSTLLIAKSSTTTTAAHGNILLGIPSSSSFNNSSFSSNPSPISPIHAATILPPSQPQSTSSASSKPLQEVNSKSFTAAPSAKVQERSSVSENEDAISDVLGKEEEEITPTQNSIKPTGSVVPATIPPTSTSTHTASINNTLKPLSNPLGPLPSLAPVTKTPGTLSSLAPLIPKPLAQLIAQETSSGGANSGGSERSSDVTFNDVSPRSSRKYSQDSLVGEVEPGVIEENVVEENLKVDDEEDNYDGEEESGDIDDILGMLDDGDNKGTTTSTSSTAVQDFSPIKTPIPVSPLAPSAVQQQQNHISSALPALVNTSKSSNTGSTLGSLPPLLSKLSQSPAPSSELFTSAPRNNNNNNHSNNQQDTLSAADVKSNLSSIASNITPAAPAKSSKTPASNNNSQKSSPKATNKALANLSYEDYGDESFVEEDIESMESLPMECSNSKVVSASVLSSSMESASLSKPNTSLAPFPAVSLPPASSSSSGWLKSAPPLTASTLATQQHKKQQDDGDLQEEEVLSDFGAGDTESEDEQEVEKRVNASKKLARGGDEDVDGGEDILEDLSFDEGATEDEEDVDENDSF